VTTLAELVELEPELVLPSHGEVVTRHATRALAAAIDAPFE
jgi:hypothetical protein